MISSIGGHIHGQSFKSQQWIATSSLVTRFSRRRKLSHEACPFWPHLRTHRFQADLTISNILTSTASPCHHPFPIPLSGAPQSMKVIRGFTLASIGQINPTAYSVSSKESRTMIIHILRGQSSGLYILLATLCFASLSGLSSTISSQTCRAKPDRGPGL